MDSEVFFFIKIRVLPVLRVVRIDCKVKTMQKCALNELETTPYHSNVTLQNLAFGLRIWFLLALFSTIFIQHSKGRATCPYLEYGQRENPETETNGGRFETHSSSQSLSRVYPARVLLQQMAVALSTLFIFFGGSLVWTKPPLVFRTMRTDFRVKAEQEMR